MSNIYGLSKKGKPLTRSQWLYKLNQESKSKYVKDSFGSPQAYLNYKHHELLEAIGEEAYHKEFDHITSYYTLTGGRYLPTDKPPTAEEQDPDTVNEPSETGDQIEKTPQKRPAEPAEGDTPSKHVKGFDERDFQTSGSAQESNVPSGPGAEPIDVDIDMAGAGMRSGGGGGIADQPLQFFKAQGLRQIAPNKFVFNNTFRLRSFGNVLFLQLPNTVGVEAPRVTTPMVSLPVEWIWFYIPYSTYKWMAETDTFIITHCAVKVTPIGQMISFGTNSATSDSAAPSHTMYGMANVGINLEWPTDSVNITRNSTSPMEIASVTRATTSDVWIERLWGNPNKTAPSFHSSINHEIILPTTYLRLYQLSNFTSIAAGVQQGQVTLSAGPYGNIPLNRYLTKFPLKAHNGKPIINYEYTFKNPLRSKPRSYQMPASDFRGSATSTTTFTAQFLRTRSKGNYSTFNVNRNNDFSIPTNNVNIDSVNASNIQFGFMGAAISDYNSCYLEGALPMRYDMEPDMRKAQPGVFFGVEAVQANVPEISPSYVNASCDWYVETELFFEFSAKAIDYPWVPANLANTLEVMHVNDRHAPLRETVRLNATRYNTNAVLGEKLNLNNDPLTTGEPLRLDYDLYEYVRGDQPEEKEKKHGDKRNKNISFRT